MPDGRRAGQGAEAFLGRPAAFPGRPAAAGPICRALAGDLLRESLVSPIGGLWVGFFSTQALRGFSRVCPNKDRTQARPRGSRR